MTRRQWGTRIKGLAAVPWHPVLFAAFPTLALLAANLREVSPAVALRPLVASLFLALPLLVAARLLLRAWARAALLTSFLMALFFSYGHLYQALRTVPVIGMQIARHRYLGPLYLALALLAGTTLLRVNPVPARVTMALNLMGAALVITPVVQLLLLERPASIDARQIGHNPEVDQRLVVDGTLPPPDIYYIILDTYTRQDALLRDYGYDNSAFVDSLESMGFYVADCARSNYGNTHESLGSSLNLDYLENLEERLQSYGFDANDYWALIKINAVQQMLASAGYKIVAFDTEYEWSRLTTADYYLSLSEDPILVQRVNPFEALLLKSTALLVLTDLQYLNRDSVISRAVDRVNFPYAEHARMQLFILDQLPQTAALPGPKFVFAHILIPHVPRIFAADGSILSDPGYYGGKLAGPVNEDYDRRGYVQGIQFISQRMLAIVEEILRRSERPPVIIIQGDTGAGGENKYEILNAYYLPGAEARLYPSITPVNTFRLIFDVYFGAAYDLLPDVSYGDPRAQVPIPETAPQCKNP